MNELYRREDWIGTLRVADSAQTLLCQLFSPSLYSNDEKNLYQYIGRSSVENFIYREILAYTDIIEITYPNQYKINFKKELELNLASVYDWEFFYRLAVVYFLNCRHNSKIQRCEPEKYEGKQLDDFLMERIFNVAYQCCAYEDEKKEAKWFQKHRSYYTINSDGRAIINQKIKSGNTTIDLFQKVFDIVQRTTFTLNIHNGGCYQWNVQKKKEEHSQNIIIFEITSKANLDLEQDSYEKLIQYLCTKERNRIADFDENDLWYNRMKAGPRQERNLSMRNAANTDLMLFCLALGLDNDVYELLRKRRNKKFNNQKPGKGSWALQGEEEQKKLQSFLNTHTVTERLKCTFDDTKNPKDVPHRMLINASLDLIKSGLFPVIKFTEEEQKIFNYKELIETYLDKEKLEALNKHFSNI